MRAALAGAALGAALLTGGTTAVAQAAPAATPAESTTTVTPRDTPFSWERVGRYPTEAACVADGKNSAHAKWECTRNGSRWELWVETNS
ncbi:hypothetical protein [Streptomyces sp. NPDC057702]|uniref:hypothetical protein n=1 Tax=unclassified Streptomyces TaxID=2593676 RepID=UPI00368E6857